MLPQDSRQKSLDSQKNSLDLKKITRLTSFASKLAVLLQMMYLFTLLPKKLYIICKFAKIDHLLKHGKTHTNNNLQAFVKS